MYLFENHQKPIEISANSLQLMSFYVSQISYDTKKNHHYIDRCVSLYKQLFECSTYLTSVKRFSLLKTERDRSLRRRECSEEKRVFAGYQPCSSAFMLTLCEENLKLAEHKTREDPIIVT